MVLLDKKEFKLFLTFFLIYAIFAQFYGWPAASRIDLALAMVYDNSFAIDRWKDTSPFNTKDVAFYNGHYYLSKAPLDSFLIVPPLYLFKLFFGYPEWWSLRWLLLYLITLLNPVLFSALSCVVLYHLLKYFIKDNRTCLLVTFAYGLCASVMFLATLFMGPSSSTFFIILSFYLLFKMKKKEEANTHTFFLTGILLGMAVVGEYTYFFAVLCLTAYSAFNFRKIKYVFCVFLGIILIVSMLFLYHHLIFDEPFAIEYSLLDKTMFPSAPQIGFEGTTFVNWMKYMGDVPLLKVPLMLKTEILINNFLQILFFPFRGLFFFNPILLLGIIGLFYMRKEHKSETWLIVIMFAFYTAWFSSRSFWFAGEGITTRRLMPVIPFLMIPVGYAFKRLNRKVAYAFLLITVLIGIITLQNLDYSLNYTRTDMLFKYEFMCLYHLIDFPLLTYYLPLFVKFGPSSHLIEKGLNMRLPPFLNMLVISVFISLIWINSITAWVRKRKRIILAITLILLILIGVRILFALSINHHIQNLYQYHFTEKKECQSFFPVYDELTSRLNNTRINTRLTAPNRFTDLADYRFFNIPYILEIDSEVRPDNAKNKNWYKAPNDYTLTNYTSMSQDATIQILNREDKPKKVVLEFEVGTLLNDTLFLYLNDKILSSYSILEYYNEENPGLTKTKFEDYDIPLDLAPGMNFLVFHSEKGCYAYYNFFPTSKDISCKSFVFNQLRITDITSSSV